jgi:hypothetical protein
MTNNNTTKGNTMNDTNGLKIKGNASIPWSFGSVDKAPVCLSYTTKENAMTRMIDFFFCLFQVMTFGLSVLFGIVGMIVALQYFQ